MPDTILASLCIRKAILSDASEISQVIIESIRQANTQDYSLDMIHRLENKYTTEQIIIKINTQEVFIACLHSRVTGTISLDGSKIRSLFVLPEEQHCGIGGALMNYVEGIAKEKNLDCLSLASSIAARGFYQKLEYIAVRSECRDTGQVIIMEKMLISAL